MREHVRRSLPHKLFAFENEQMVLTSSVVFPLLSLSDVLLRLMLLCVVFLFRFILSTGVLVLIICLIKGCARFSLIQSIPDYYYQLLKKFLYGKKFRDTAQLLS